MHGEHILVSTNRGGRKAIKAFLAGFVFVFVCACFILYVCTSSAHTLSILSSSSCWELEISLVFLHGSLEADVHRFLIPQCPVSQWIGVFVLDYLDFFFNRLILLLSIFWNQFHAGFRIPSSPMPTSASSPLLCVAASACSYESYDSP